MFQYTSFRVDFSLLFPLPPSRMPPFPDSPSHGMEMSCAKLSDFQNLGHLLYCIFKLYCDINVICLAIAFTTYIVNIIGREDFSFEERGFRRRVRFTIASPDRLG